MRRRAVCQGLKKKSETRAGLLVRHAERLENQGLHIASVNPDRTARDFDSVDNGVVSFRANLAEQLSFAFDCALEHRHIVIEW